MSVALNPPSNQTYNVGPVKPWVEKAAYIIGPLFHITNIGGWRQSDPFPDHPSGHALDFMVSNPGTSNGYKQGDSLANYAVQHYQELGIKYIIWNGQYWDPQQGWGPYTATSNPHTDHVHITFNDSPGSWTGSNATTSLSSSNVPSTGLLLFDSKQTCAWKLSFPVFGDTCVFTKVFVRQFVGFALIGVGGAGVIIGIAIIAAFTFKSTPMLQQLQGSALGRVVTKGM